MIKSIIIAFILLSLVACVSDNKYKKLPPSTNTVAQSLYTIDTQATNILETKELPIAKDSAKIIKDETQTASKAITTLKEIENKNEELKEEVKEIESKPIESTKRMFVWLAGLGALTMLAGAVALALQQKAIAGILLISGVIGTCICLLFITFAKLIATIMLALFIACLAYAIYLVYKHRKQLENQIFKDKKIKEELIETAQFLKKHSWDEGTKKTIDRFQSEDTKAEVSELKHKEAKAVVKARFNEK